MITALETSERGLHGWHPGLSILELHHNTRLNPFQKLFGKLTVYFQPLKL
jgi:hypothetical protein